MTPAGESDALVRMLGVGKRYQRGADALAGVDLTLARGEMAFLTGHSGAGKSTLLRLIALLERPSRGQLLVDGENIGRLPARRVPYHRRRIGLIFQDHRLLDDRSVFDNVALPLVVAGVSAAEIGRRARAALDQVGLLSKERVLPSALSAGEQQRVGIARAVVGKPPLILADEPTGNLDPRLSREIMELFSRLNQVGTTVLIATHDLALIADMHHRVIALDKGRLASADDRGRR